MSEQAAFSLATELARLNWSIAFAESMTAGYACGELARVSGISKFLRGGFVTYDIPAKVALLGVDQVKAEACDAVAPEIARQMAQGVRTAFGVDLGLATTGLAEPWKGREPIAYIALCCAGLDEGIARELDLRIWPDREARRRAVVTELLSWAASQLAERHPARA